MLRVQALPALTDNYIWLIENPDLQQCAVVDPGDAHPVLTWLEQHPHYVLTDILITHHHQDHTAGISALREKTAARVVGASHSSLPQMDTVFTKDAPLSLWGETWRVLAVPGHTLDHIAFVYSAADTSWLFCGDTLFAAGCGRIFEGTAQQMYQALQRFAALPENTQIFCAHEYTQSNLGFAQKVEPSNVRIQQRIQEVTALRAQQQATLPSHLALELQTNPFLRTQQPEIISNIREQYPDAPSDTPEAVFKLLRDWKNNA